MDTYLRDIKKHGVMQHKISLYDLAHTLRAKFPFIWNFIELLNAWLFNIRYSRRLGIIQQKLFSSFNHEYGMRVVPLREVQTEKLVDFFAAQPASAFKFFKPHGFDTQSINKLKTNKAFLGYVMQEDNSIVSYFFLRCSFTGKAYRGKIVDSNSQGKGIAKLAGLFSTKICSELKLRQFATISKDNIASFKSSKAINNIISMKELPNGYVYIEYGEK